MNRLNKKFLLLQLSFVIAFFFLLKFLRSFRHVDDAPSEKGYQSIVDKHNSDHLIRNHEKFESLKNDSVVIVVQVHKRVSYLRHLVLSLSTAKEISETLLIFSHDFYDQEINELVQSIDYCKVMQIFYPWSIQNHPNEFPGTDPKDCGRDMNKEQALDENCQNALFPDLYGHYREASFTQTKHHWWWKANRVFDQLEVTRHHTGLVLFLEEDHYVTEDFLHVLKLMQSSSTELCQACNVVSLGTYDSNLDKENFDKVENLAWKSTKHNMGMAINRTTWHEIKSCAKHFCSYDDYNWDWSLQHANNRCLKTKLTVMMAKGPRVFHIGECGLHHTKVDCDVNEKMKEVEGKLEASRELLFPENLTNTLVKSPMDLTRIVPYGGWSDIRDVAMCLKMCL